MIPHITAMRQARYDSAMRGARTDVENELLGRDGSTLVADDEDALFAQLAEIAAPIPRRTAGRTSDDRERDCLVRYLRLLRSEGLLGELAPALPSRSRVWPLQIVKQERPDFLFRFPDGSTRGLEITDAGTERHQRAATALENAPVDSFLERTVDRGRERFEIVPPGDSVGDRDPGYIGDEAERRWAQVVADAAARKAAALADPRLPYGRADVQELLIYDQTALLHLVPLRDARPYLVAELTRREFEGFGRLSILRDGSMLFDVTGQPRIEGVDEEDLQRKRHALHHLCRQHRILNLRAFGSVLGAHGEDFRPDSDLDLLVVFEPQHAIGYFGLEAIQQELTELLGRRVDLRTPQELSRYFREDVLQEAVILHRAS